MRLAGHAARMGREEVHTGFWLGGRSEGRRQIRRPRRRWEDNTTMDLQEVGWRGARTGLIWLRTGTGGGLLGMR